MKFFIIISIFVSALSVANAACIREGYVLTPGQRTNMKIIDELVARYDSLSYARNGQSIQLKYHIDSCDTFQLLGGHDSKGAVVIEVFSGALKKFDQNQIVSATCHELGHILGDITLADAGVINQATSPDGVEGEADYFAGKCTLDYFRNVNLARSALRATYESLYKMKINEASARNQFYLYENGIHSSYPSAECRQLSAFQGLEQKPRPTCWYNPKLSTKIKSSENLEF